MTEYPKIQSRFDAAMDSLEAAIASLKASENAEKLAQRVAALEAEADSAKNTLEKARKRAEDLEMSLEAKTADAEAQRTAMVKQIDALNKAKSSSDEELAKTRQYNKHLKKLNSELRKKNEDNVGDADLINQSLEAELEQIKAQRDVDLEEINGILARLTPLVEGN